MLSIEQPERINLPNENLHKFSNKVTKSEEIKSEKRNQNIIRKLYHFPKKLRYTLAMDVVYPEDEGRKFILEYSLADGMIRIIELACRNSGRIPGLFLNWIYVPKPDDSEYYTPNDFRIGSKLNILGHWFVITGTELFVYSYMMSNPQKFDKSVQENIREYLKLQGLIDEPIDCNEVVPAEIKDKSNEIEKHPQVDSPNSKD
jgi:hypothetical protein